MATKKTKVDVAARRIAALLEEHIGTLPPGEAKELLSDVNRLAAKSSRTASRGKASQSRRTADPRPLSRASAKHSAIAGDFGGPETF
jgi:hypothetical protein